MNQGDSVSTEENRKDMAESFAREIEAVVTEAARRGFDISATSCCCGGGLEITDLRGPKFGFSVFVEGV